MNVPTGDYLVQFFDYQGALLPNACVLVATLTEAQARAADTAPLVKAYGWRILRCVGQSTDKGAW